MSEVIRTGVFATDAEIELLEGAMNAPLLLVGGTLPESPAMMAHAYALRHGLPEVSGYYGVDLQTGEFLKAGPR